MSYTYPEALNALESVANDLMQTLHMDKKTRPLRARVVCSSNARTASVTWDAYSGARIELPAKPATSRMTEEEFQDWVAYALHELGHPTFTDKHAWVKACDAGVGELTNSLEDVRMEKRVIDAGKVLNAKTVLSRLVSRKLVEARADGYRPNARASFGWTICVLGRAANGYLFEASDIAWINSQINPAGTVASILAWALPALAACNTTADCAALAAKIAAALAKPQPKGQQGQQGQQEGEGEEEGEGEGEGEPKGEGEGEQGEQGEGDAGDAGEPKGEGEGEGDSEAPSNEKPTSKPRKGRKGKGKGKGDNSQDDELPVMSEKDLDKVNLTPKQSDVLKGQAATNARQVIEILRDAKVNAKPRTYGMLSPVPVMKTESLRATAANASRQRALLARALRANEQDEREGGRKAGRLDRGALSRAVAGSANVFTKRDLTEGYDTDVCVLLDASGSMGTDTVGFKGTRMDQAAEAGLVIAQAASSVGASCTIEAFNSGGFVRAGDIASKRKPDVESFARMALGAGGGTPLSENLARAGLAQAARASHKRRVLFVITDGDCDHGHETVKVTADYLAKTYGTVLAHVSIVTPLRGAFKAEVQIKPGQQITDVGLESFVRVLQAL